MRRRVGYIALSAAMLVVVSGLAIAQAATDITAPETIVLTNHTVKNAAVNVGDKRFGPGDLYMFVATLSDETGTQVGTAHIQCTAQPGRTQFCTGAFIITGRGQIVGEGAIQGTASSFDVPITGGTGDFDNVRGYVHVEPIDQNNETDTLYLLP
jgi:hypothetical protein